MRGGCLLVIVDYYRGAITDRNVFVIDPHLNNYMAPSCEWEGGFANVGTPIVRVCGCRSGSRCGDDSNNNNNEIRERGIFN